MRKSLFSIATISLLFSTLASCERGYTEGVEDNEVNKSQVLGGWKFSELRFQLVYSAANPLAWMMPTLKGKMKENLERRVEDASLFFMQDTVFFVIEPNEEGLDTYVNKRSYYYITNHPGTIHPEEKYLICNSYADFFYVKFDEKNNMSLYMTRDAVMELIREDGSLSSTVVNLIDRNIDDAQFEFYMIPYYIPFYDEIVENSGVTTDTTTVD